MYQTVQILDRHRKIAIILVNECECKIWSDSLNISTLHRQLLRHQFPFVHQPETADVLRIRFSDEEFLLV